MKKILVPVDFSECATYAADLAVSLAEKLNAEVHFLTSLQSTPLWAKIGENLLSDYTESYKRQKEAAENLQVLRSRYADRHVPISLSFSTKALLDLIPRYVDKEDITMIVMGSAGAAGLKEWMVGSHTQKVVRLSSVPVLVIKHPLNSVALRNVAFASDFKADAKDAFRQAVEFVTPFGPHMHLVHIHSAETGDKAGDIDAFARMCWQLPVSRHDIQDLGIEL
ncbi:MAG: universal stress protein, partial [Bacteroidetes bacterium]